VGVEGQRKEEEKVVKRNTVVKRVLNVDENHKQT